jgi:hypothetical protein
MPAMLGSAKIGDCGKGKPRPQPAPDIFTLLLIEFSRGFARFHGKMLAE